MRLTVGPLPPAVYWRRRAVVLGAVLLFLIVLVYSCNGTKEAGTDPLGNPTPTAGPILTPETGTPESGAPDPGTPGTSAPTEDPSGAPPDGTDPQVEPAGGPPGNGQQLPPPPAPVENECTDEEMSVVPVPSQTSMQRGQTIQLRLRIKNVSDRTCNRDVGADVQEIYIKAGASTIWSSDVCSPARGTNVKPFPPNHEEEFGLPWNGRRSSGCDNGTASGDHPPAGTYQLFGRLGEKRSDPVRITITN